MVMDNIVWMLMSWMAETIYTKDYLNEWFYQLKDIDNLLVVVGKELLHIFNMIN